MNLPRRVILIAALVALLGLTAWFVGSLSGLDRSSYIDLVGPALGKVNPYDAYQRQTKRDSLILRCVAVLVLITGGAGIGFWVAGQGWGRE